MSFWTGTQGGYDQRSIYGKEQMPLYQQRLRAAQQQGAGGAFGDSADFYRNQLNNQDPYAAYNDLSAPIERQFREQIVPGLAEQFAGMGSGGLDSSGFRNAAVGAGADLSERLGAIRAQLRQQGIQNQFNAAQGLEGIGQGGLNQSYENIFRSPTPGFLESVAPAVGTIAGAALGGPAGAALGGSAGNAFGSLFKNGEKNINQAIPGYGNPSRSSIQNWKPSQRPMIGRGF